MIAKNANHARTPTAVNVYRARTIATNVHHTNASLRLATNETVERLHEVSVDHREDQINTRLKSVRPPSIAAR